MSLLKEKGVGDLYTSAEKSTSTIKVIQTSAEASTYDSKTKTIEWNPNMGAALDNADTSPTTVLNHELDHAFDHVKNPEAHEKRVATSDDKYGNKEEARVIKGSEQKTARALGEIPKGIVTRTNHKGQYYPTASPTSAKPLVQQQLEEKSKNKTK